MKKVVILSTFKKLWESEQPSIELLNNLNHQNTMKKLTFIHWVSLFLKFFTNLVHTANDLKYCLISQKHLHYQKTSIFMAS